MAHRIKIKVRVIIGAKKKAGMLLAKGAKGSFTNNFIASIMG